MPSATNNPSLLADLGIIGLEAIEPVILAALITLASGATDSRETRAALEQHLDRVNAVLASYETVKKFAILPREFTPETGELTPSLKIRRGFVQEKYRSIIDALYGADSESPSKEQTHETFAAL